MLKRKQINTTSKIKLSSFSSHYTVILMPGEMPGVPGPEDHVLDLFETVCNTMHARQIKKPW